MCFCEGNELNGLCQTHKKTITVCQILNKTLIANNNNKSQHILLYLHCISGLGSQLSSLGTPMHPLVPLCYPIQPHHEEHSNHSKKKKKIKFNQQKTVQYKT